MKRFILLKAKYLTFFLLLCLTQNGFGQGIKDRLFHSIGGQFGYVRFTPTNIDDPANSFQQLKFVSIDLLYSLRYNIYEPSPKMAIAASISPAFGSAEVEGNFGKLGKGAIFVPLRLEFLLGAGATYDSDGTVGLGLGAGLEYAKLPLFNEDLKKSDNTSTYVLPHLYMGVSWWNGDNMLNEVFVNYSPQKKGEIDSGDNPIFIQLGWRAVLGY